MLKTKDITAGNSSGINDGACALIIASGEKVEELGFKPLARLVDCLRWWGGSRANGHWTSSGHQQIAQT